MLPEILQYVTTPCPAHLREMGFLKELIGIGSRYQRCRKAWTPHLENTRSYILECAKRCRRRQTVVVLGSGWLLDVPWKELGELFDKVIFVDLVHLRKVRKLTQGMKGTYEWVAADITGLLRSIYDQMESRPRGARFSELTLTSVPPRNFGNVSLMVSCNVLSQLPRIPEAWLRDRGLLFDSGNTALTQSLVLGHLELLRAYAASEHCIVTDVESVAVSTTGENDSIHLVPDAQSLLGIPERDWWWEIAPKGEHVDDLAVRHRVHAYWNPL
jgi:hypothetical protein